MQTILIIGRDSMIGRALMKHLEGTGMRVIGTTRRNECINELDCYLDLSENTGNWQCQHSVDVAIICAGVTKLQSCKSNPEKTALINVEGVTNLVKRFIKQGIFVIFLSTNQVFDGKLPYRMPNDSFSPVTEYGRQKAEVERQISQWRDMTAIVRFTKILDPRYPLFFDWLKLLKKGEPVQAFSNMFMAPVSLSCAILVLQLVANRCMSGIIQVSGNQDISYAEAARSGADILGVGYDLIQSAEISKLNNEPVPVHTTLNVDRIKSEFGIQPADAKWTIENCFSDIAASIS